METLHARIRELRLRAGMTQATLAAKIGLRQQAISEWEASQVPRATVIPDLAQALGVTLNEMFGVDPDFPN